MSTSGPRDDASSISADDAALRNAIRALPPAIGTERLEALRHRVLAQWRQTAPTARPAATQDALVHGDASVQFGPNGATLVRGGGKGGGPGLARMVWLGLTAVAITLAIGLKMWQQAHDPVLDELIKIDVLSQMAAGEM